ncbi:hypothetical protein FAEUMB_05480 [Faecalimonas umbilicata]|uniref:Uncharacterized protein n=1 Tax=Faecalimonas umbilicata TaxID=1912855 RepID=A0ABQ0QUL4_9FIRM|nr:hypothetical protein FAEUMB_05480 [Faecalimonas umbilicata]
MKQESPCFSCGECQLENGNIREKADGLCRLANAKVWSMKDESQTTGIEV